MKKLVLLFALSILAGCGAPKPQTPGPEFAPYITAYTGGVISTSGSIRIELASPRHDVALNEPVEERLFDFSPSLKGQAYWVSGSTIEFIPEAGALKAGRLYAGRFLLGKVEQVERALEEFPFSFRTREQEFTLQVGPGVVSEQNPEVMRFSGTIFFSDRIDARKVVGMMELEGMKVTSIDPSEGMADRFTFTYEGIERSGKEQMLTLSVSGRPAGIAGRSEQVVVVPAVDRFKVTDVRLIDEPQNGLSVTFSEPLDKDQDLEGFITIDGIGDHVMQAQDNRVSVFFDRPAATTLTVNIAEGIRSSNGLRLEEAERVSLQVEALEPQIELLSSGVILPDASNLLLRFRTASLRAVDVKIIRIYASNVPMFLQDNALSGSDELRRSGRLVYHKPLALTGASAGSVNAWQEWAVDLSGIIRQEPGAIYRIRLEMREQDALYPCGEVREPGGDNAREEGVVQLTPEGLTEQEQAEWDQPNTYYYDSGIDWDVYDWSDRDDPCTPSYYMRRNSDAPAINLLASSLGMVVKSGGEGEVLVAVNEILSTKPVADAQVTLYDFQLRRIASAKSDATGMARLTPSGKGFLAVAEKAGAKSYVKIADNEALSLSRFDVGGAQVQRGMKGFVYGERGVWRPGDTLFLAVLLDQPGTSLPASHPVTLELYNPRGQFYTRQVNAKSVGGFYRFDIPTRADDPTGTWNAYAKVGGASFHKALRIEAIKPNRLKIEFSIPGGRIDADRSTTATLTSSWLTGAVARSLEVKAEMTLARVATAFKGYEKFTFDNPAASFTPERIELLDGRLDQQGKTRIAVAPPKLRRAPGMLRADIVARVYEPGGDVSVYADGFAYSPYARYVGVDLASRLPASGQYDTDRDQLFDVALVDAEGKPANAKLNWRVYKLNWSWWWNRSGESLASWVDGQYTDPVAEGTLQTSGGRGQFKLRVDYPEWGRYLIYVEDPTGGHATGGVVYIDWPATRGRAERQNPDGATMLTFTTDKKSYRVGERATVTIPAAPGGRALVSFEKGSGVMRTTWVEMPAQGDAKYSFEVTPQMAPNIYLHITRLSPHAATADARPIRLYGVQPLMVENPDSHLEPVLKVPAVARPETAFPVSVSEKSGRAMSYTLAVVDEGLLDLTNFRTPDPWAAFHAREALGVRTWDLYDNVIGAFGGKMPPLLSVGGSDEAAVNPDRKANRFKPVVRYLGPFTLRRGGTATHRVDLPMYVGSVRVMVVAGQQGAYGSTQQTVPVRAPLMLLSTLPRVVSTGEAITMPVNLFAMEPEVKNVAVKVELTGALSVAGASSLNTRFAVPGEELVTFALRAGATSGMATVRVTATSGQHRASEVIQIEVRNPNPPVILTEQATLPANGSIDMRYSLGDFRGAQDEENHVTLEVARMPSVDLTRRYDYLSNYQHLCSEQLTSRGLPMLYLETFREVGARESERIKSGVRQIISLLYSRQASSGGIFYWPGYTSPDAWITSYAGHFLLEAQRHGYEVNAGVLGRWKQYQGRAARNWSMPTPNYGDDLEQAYRLYTLALAGAPETGAMNRLKEAAGVSVAAKWRLAAAYAVAGRTAAANEVVASMGAASSSPVDNYSYYYYYGSPQRDAAMALEAMVLMGDMDGAMRQARILSKMLGSESYLSTQSTAFSLAAMGTLAAKVSAGTIDYTLSIDGREVQRVTSPRAVHQLRLPLSSASGRVTLQSHSPGELFVVQTTHTRPAVDREPAMGQGLRLAINYADMQGRIMRVDSLSQGDDFQAIVTITNTSGTSDYDNLALTHIVPAGWEIFPTIAATPTVRAYDYQDVRDDRVLTYFSLRRGETKRFAVRLQATYMGDFVLPALLVEAMYEPTIRARTAAGRVRVR